MNIIITAREEKEGEGIFKGIDPKTAKFLMALQKQSGDRFEIFLDRCRSGENNRIPMDQAFLRGWKSILDILWVKVNRVAGYSDQWEKGDLSGPDFERLRESTLEELSDLGNYADWCAVDFRRWCDQKNRGEKS